MPFRKILKSTATAPAPGQSHVVHFASCDERRDRWSSSLESRGWKYSQMWEAVSTNGNPDTIFPQHKMDAVNHHWANRQEQDWKEHWWWTQGLRRALPSTLHLLLQGLNLYLLIANDLALGAPLCGVSVDMDACRGLGIKTVETRFLQNVSNWIPVLLILMLDCWCSGWHVMMT